MEMLTLKRKGFRNLSAAAFCWFMIGVAKASSAGGGDLPWEGPLKKIADSLTGPVALAISLIAFVVAGGTLVFGGELSEFARRAVMVVMAVAFLVLGSQFMSTLFGVSGALI